MFRLTSKLTIESGKIGNNKRFVIPNFVSNIEINSSWDTLGDTCIIELPKKVNWEGTQRLVDDGFGTSNEPALFERGDKIKVELGYDDANFTMFEGFISDIEPDSPLKLTCKDMMWYLDQIRLDKTYMKLIDGISDVVGDVVSGATDVVGSFLGDRASAVTDRIGNAVEDSNNTIATFLTPLLGIVNGNLSLRGIKPEFKFSLLDESGLPAIGNFMPTGKFRFPHKNSRNDSVAGLLKELKDKYDVYFWFRNNVLQVDVGGRLKTNSENVIQRVGADLIEGAKDEAFRDKKVVWPFHFQRNVIAQDLNYVNEERTPLIVEVSGTPPENKKENKEKIIDNGVTRALSNAANAINSLSESIGIDLVEFVQVQFTNIKGNSGASVKQKINFSQMTKLQLLAIAERTYNNLRYTGFKGSITTFGQYPVKHGDIAQLTDERHPERNGAYLIRSVNTTFGMGGYRQQLFLERNVTNKLKN